MISRADSTDVRRGNLSAVLRRIALGPCARTEIADDTGLVHASVTALVADLAGRGLVEETGAVATGVRGRPRRLLRLAPGRVRLIAVQVLHDEVALRVSDLPGTLTHTDRRACRAPFGDPAPVADAIGGLIENALTRAEGAHLGQAVVAVPGPVVRGAVGASIGLGWRTTDLAALVADRLPSLRLPIEIVNEADVAALAEYRALAAAGVPRPDTVIYVTAHAGVGGGLIIGGHIHRGSHGMAGEIGHVPVSLDGSPCRCGARGCLDTYLNLIALARAAGLHPGPGGPAALREELDRRLRAAEPAAVQALDRAGHALGAALLGVAGATDAGEAILGGYLADWAPWLMPAVNDRLHARRTAIDGVGLTVTVGTLGADATLQGAVETGRERLLSDPGMVPPGGPGSAGAG